MKTVTYDENEWQLVPKHLVDMFCVALDNIGDLPIPEAFAERFYKEGSELLKEHDYFRESQPPIADSADVALKLARDALVAANKWVPDDFVAAGICQAIDAIDTAMQQTSKGNT